MECSAKNDNTVEEVFVKVAEQVLAKIKNGQIDVNDPKCGVKAMSKAKH